MPTSNQFHVSTLTLITALAVATLAAPANLRADDSATKLTEWRNACDTGTAARCTDYGLVVERLGLPSGLGGTGAPEPEKALPFFERGCELGDARGCTYAGRLHAAGAGAAQDYTKAAQRFAGACADGDGLGCMELGRLYLDGIAVEQNDKTAFQLMERACENKEAAGCTLTGFLYGIGRGTVRDPIIARVYLSRGCEGGDTAGCEALKAGAEEAK